MSLNLPKIHALTGCNTTSYFYWVGKIKVLKKLLGQQDLCDCNWTRTRNHLVDKWTLNHLAIVYELSGCWFESSCSHLNFGFRAYFEQGVLWHSGNYRVWIHPEKRTWHDKNIQTRLMFYIVKARKLLAQSINDVIEDTKEFIRATLYNGNKKSSYANYKKV